MPLHVAFLRGINLGSRRVKMARLRKHFEELGLERVDSFLASGNLVFEHSGTALGELEEVVERHLAEALGYEVATFVRPLDRLGELLEAEGVAEAVEEGFTPYVIFLREDAGGEVRERLEALETPDDRFLARGKEVLWFRRGRLTDSAIEQRDLEAALGGADNTRRKLNTVRRIVEKFGG